MNETVDIQIRLWIYGGLNTDDYNRESLSADNAISAEMKMDFTSLPGKINFNYFFLSR